VRTRERWLFAALMWAASGQAAFADALTDKAVAAVQKAAPDLAVSVRNPNELRIQTPKGPFTLYLDNIRAACTSNAANCDAELESFVSRTVSVIRLGEEDRAVTPEKLFVVLRSAGFGKRAGQQFPNDEKKQPIVTPFVEGIETLYVLDTPKAFRFINHSDLETAGLTVDRLHEIATRNASTLKQVEYKPAPNTPGIYFMPAGDGLGTARIFDGGLWDRIEKEHGPVVVCAPTRDWVLFVKQDNRNGVEQLKVLANRIVRGEAYPVSPVMFRRHNGGWQVYAG